MKRRVHPVSIMGKGRPPPTLEVLVVRADPLIPYHRRRGPCHLWVTMGT